MEENFYQAFLQLEDIQQPGTLQYSKIANEWHNNLVEKEPLTQIQQVLSKLSENVDKFEVLLQECLDKKSIESYRILILLSTAFGFIVPLTLYKLEGLLQLIAESFVDQFQEIKILLIYYGQYNYKEINSQIPKIDSFQCLQMARQLQISSFDKQYISLLDNLINYQQDKQYEIYLKILKQYENLMIYSIHPLHQILIQDIYKVIKFESDELTKDIMDQQLEEYYNTIPTLKDIKVVRCKNQMLERNLFILGEYIRVKEDQTIEYKEMTNLEPKNLFIIKKAITAFLNQEGGSLFIGIKDSLEIRGFYIGEDEFVMRNFLYQNCISKIHPTLILEKDIFIDICPLYNQEGELIEHYGIIRIRLVRQQKCKNIYTFGELIEHYQSCEATFCFKRYQDTSRAVKHDKLKQLINIIEQNDHQINNHNQQYRRGREINVRYFDRRGQSCNSNRDKLSSEVFYKENIQQKNKKQQQFEIIESIIQPDSQVIENQEEKLQEQQEIQQYKYILKELNYENEILNIQSGSSNDTEQKNDEEQKMNFINEDGNDQLIINQLVDQRQNWIIFRKQSEGCTSKLISFLNYIKSYTQQILEIIIVDSTIHVFVQDFTQTQLLEQIQQLAHNENQVLRFSVGQPKYILIPLNCTQDNLEEIISKQTNLHNFNIRRRSQFDEIKAIHIKDLIKIYECLRIKLKIKAFWRLNDQQDKSLE